MSDTTPNYPKKLIEVSIPLKEINEASAREKSIKHGHPSTLHLWWARRPLAAARAVLFCQLVDDPSGYVDELIADKARRKRAEEQLAEELKMAPHVSEKVEDILVQRERDRLHDIVKELVVWENTNNEKVLSKARKEIQKSWARTCRREGKPENTRMPPFLDPFAGGGAIPLEAQRLGLDSHASDLNPVAVLINKAMIEIPPKFADMPPVHPDAQKEMGTTGWKGAAGLAEDVRRYGQWMRDEVFKRIGHLYPPYKLTKELIDSRPDLKKAGYKAGDELTVIAWLWVRTVPSPNPVLGGKKVPLVSSFNLSTKKGKQAWVEPIIENGDYRFNVRSGKQDEPNNAKDGTKTGRGANFQCLLSGAPISAEYVKAEGKAGRMGWKLLAIVCEGKGRIYVPANPEDEERGLTAVPNWTPPGKLATHPQYMSCTNYGPSKISDLFMDRQLLALSEFATLLRSEVSNRIEKDCADHKNRTGYKEAVVSYLSLSIGRLANRQSTNTFWDNTSQKVQQVFSRHALPFVWDTAEGNPFSDSSGNFMGNLEYLAKAVAALPCGLDGFSEQGDARTVSYDGRVVSTDPPYFDNVPYADLSDFFYVWLRSCLREVFPSLFETILVPKADELVADSQRHGGKRGAEEYFLNGMTSVISKLASESHPAFPVTIYYAFRHSEKSEEGIITSGWESFLNAVLTSGYAIDGTWPIRTELVGNLKKNWNALASSIVLVCRKRRDNANLATRREFVQALQKELPEALRDLQHGNIAPVDLPQSSIGPGMAIFSRYSKVVEADGSPMTVRTAIQLINQAVEEFLTEQEAQMDEWTRFSVAWFSEYAFGSGRFGDAQSIATAKGVTVEGVEAAGIVSSGRGTVRILRPEELSSGWDPVKDDRLTIWEIVHNLIRILKRGSEREAAEVIRRVGGLAHDARALCYRLYTLCEQNKWADEGRDYNLLMTEWARLQDRANQLRGDLLKQSEMFE